MAELDNFFASQQPITITVLGLDIAFRPGADMKRAQRAAKMIEKRYVDQKLKSQGVQSKDILLTFLALGLADELLQLKTRQGIMRTRIETLLEKIEKSL